MIETPLDIRIRWNRLRVMGALMHVEQDVHAIEKRWRGAQQVWRYAAPVLTAAGVAWTLHARGGIRRGGRLISLVFGIRSAMAMARSLRALFHPAAAATRPRP